KFTDDGAITLRLNAWPDEDGAHVLLIDIEDTGAGMTPEQLARLFTPFDQTADGVAARYGGSGLGLAISRDLIELMGGRLTVRSEAGQGSTFTVALTLSEGVEDGEVAAFLAAPPLAGAPPAATPPRRPLPVDAPPAPREETETPLAAAPAEPDHDAERPLRVLVVDDHA